MATHTEQAKAIVQAVRAAAQAAWNVERVYLGPPAQRVPSAPYIVLTVVGWTQDFSGVSASLTQTNGTLTVSVLGRFPFPIDPTEKLQYEKLDRLGELIGQLQAGPSLAGGMLPIVTAARFGEMDAGTNGAYEIEATFEVVTRGTYSR